MYKLAPSILAADFGHLGVAVNTVEKAKAHYIHFDVMDGVFVPNISFGVPVLASIRRYTKLPFDVHLMITNPEKYIEPFIKAGADILSIHLETPQLAEDSEYLTRCFQKIRNLGKKPSIVMNPHTPLESVLPYVELVDMVLLMSVEPGFGGQSLLPFTLDKADRLANYLVKNNLEVDIQMDGGIDMKNLRTVLSAGVNVVVAGTSVFGATDIAFGVQRFLETFASFEIRNKKRRSLR
ncbi:MAG: ribulose-phosphate 3-epimerase [Defluviitaleaceae bacterium]|nr:ribulose-phosphate 3-epimerase [Defluviitaleaceae bacterium]